MYTKYMYNIRKLIIQAVCCVAKLLSGMYTLCTIKTFK